MNMCVINTWFCVLVLGLTLVCQPASACSEKCVCRYGDDEVIISVDCSRRNLQDPPELNDHYETAITHMDLSGNRLTSFPVLAPEFIQLTNLDLTNNKIVLPTETDISLYNLRVLHIGHNQIDSWSILVPIIEKLEALDVLNLTHNPITTLTAFDAPNLRTLDLSFCRIAKISEKHVLQGLPHLNILNLRGNPLRSINDLVSNSLSSLDLSNCKLTFLNSNIFENMPELRMLNISHNTRLSLTRKSGVYVHSESLKILDLSYSNMDAIEISGFPNLTTVNLRGNLIKRLRHKDFEQNTALENVVLSNNAITHINSEALHSLVMLKHFDVSYNMIRHLERDTFSKNEELTSINLSRNFIEKFSRLASGSLTHLDMSWCEVLKIDVDAFSDLPMLVHIDLSNNLFSEFPTTLRSRYLQSLNLSMCRLATIYNDTFRGFPELTQLMLLGNRFTTPFKVDFFAKNLYLRDLWLGDNPWRCECKDKGFYEWFVYINEDPMKLRDHAHLHCFSPEDMYGMTWDNACSAIWQANTDDHLASQRIYTFLIVSIMVMILSICIIMNIRRCLENRERERQEAERISNFEATREVMRYNQDLLEQRSQLNAPDPRESSPPCYDDALLLPVFTGSFASLSAKWIKDDDNVDARTLRRQRSRSEEVLSQRESVVEQNRQLRRQIIAEANERISVYPLADIPPRLAEPEPNTNGRILAYRQSDQLL